MEFSTPSSRQQVGRTFVVAVSLVGLVALGQVLAVAYVFVERVQIDANPVAPAAKSEMMAAESTTDGLPAALNGSTPAPTPPAPPAPRPESLMPAPRGDTTRVTALVEQAKGMREQGDMKSAVVKLREAETLAPDSPLVLSELAATFEQMGMNDKALDLWLAIEAMGPRAGALLQLAEMKIRETDGAGGAGAAAADDESLQPGSVIGLIEVRAIEQEDAEVKRKFKLRIGLKARTGEEIDVRDVIIQVFFYDMLDGQHIVQTNADVSSRWTTTPADWKEDGIEILEVGYTQPLPPEDAAPEDREYLGYIVRVYYKDQLEDVRADPVRLLTLFPPPLQVDG